jgi:exopolyphosphatase/guanosine-5'-triphosphate,3'-diphosphate pyrophosphatase
MAVPGLSQGQVKSQKGAYYASIDLGSNTVLLLIVQRESDGSLVEIRQEQRFPRLGEGIQQTGRIKSEKIEKTAQYLEEYLQLCRKYNVRWVKLVGTAALREAENGKEFCATIKNELNVEVNLISGEQEARLGYIGALSNKSELSGRILMVDIGGGSSEFTWGQNDKYEHEISLPIGSVKLTEKYALENRTSSSQIQQAQNFITTVLEKNSARFPQKVDTMIGTAGTFTTLAQIQMKMSEYDSKKIDSSILKLEQVSDIQAHLKELDAQQRLKIPGLVPGREDVILGGTIIAAEILRFFGKGEIIISDRGLRFGVIIEELGWEK